MRDNNTAPKFFALFLLIVSIIIGSIYVKDRGDAKKFIFDINIGIQYFDDVTGEQIPLIK